MDRNAEALDIGRYRQLPSCVLAESLSSIEDLERSGWSVASAPTLLSSPYGTALDFDGTDDSFTNTQHANETVKTVIFWAKPDTTTEQFVDLDGNTNYIHVSSGTLTATGFTTPTRYVNGVAGTTMTADTWHMVAVTTGTAVTTTSIKIGTDGSAFGDTSLKNLMMFDRALSATEISDIYYGTTFDYDKDLVSHWDMSEINPQDIGWKGNGNDGMGTGLVAADDIVYEDGDWGVEFNGSNEKIVISDSNSLDLGSIFTISLQMKENGYAENAGIIDKYTSSKAIRLLTDGLTTFGMTISDDGTNGESVFSSKTSSVGQGRKYDFSFNSGVLSFYEDGVLKDTDTFASMTSVFAGTDDMTIGWNIGPEVYFNGIINNLEIYNDALTYTQVEDLYIREGR